LLVFKLGEQIFDLLFIQELGKVLPPHFAPQLPQNPHQALFPHVVALGQASLQHGHSRLVQVFNHSLDWFQLRLLLLDHLPHSRDLAAIVFLPLKSLHALDVMQPLAPEALLQVLVPGSYCLFQLVDLPEQAAIGVLVDARAELDVFVDGTVVNVLRLPQLALQSHQEELGLDQGGLGEFPLLHPPADGLAVQRLDDLRPFGGRLVVLRAPLVETAHLLDLAF
jgi:hypothetical protein